MHRDGLSLIEVLISTVILAGIASGSLMVYSSINNMLSNSAARSEAISLIDQEIETIRNLSYDQIGTQGGAPPGNLTANKNVSSTNGYLFNMATTVRNIDDPFDGVLGGTPNDTAPADYKLIQIEINCLSCNRFLPLKVTSIASPKSLESGSNNGSLFVNVFDAIGSAVADATVRVINNSTTPTINLTDITNQNGILQLVGVPTSTQNYHI